MTRIGKKKQPKVSKKDVLTQGLQRHIITKPTNVS